MAKLAQTTVLIDPNTLEPVALMAGEEVPEWATDKIGSHLLEGPTPTLSSSPTPSTPSVGGAEPDKSPTPDKTWTVADLKEYAKDRDISLGGATTKDDILEAINEP